MESSEKGNAAFSNELRCDNSKAGAGMLKSISIIRTYRLAPGRARKATVFALLRVKSLAELSVRERS
jgi:hypothetical protein